MSQSSAGAQGTRYALSPTQIFTGIGCSRTAIPEIAGFGKRICAVGGIHGLAATAPILDALRVRKRTLDTVEFHGECTQQAIDALAARLAGADCVLGIGGGKAIDTAKAAASDVGLPCITIPTSPATCAAYTPLSILHDDQGAYLESRRLPQPLAVMVLDPELMVGLPARLLSAGCIDALARAWDTQLAARCGVPSHMAALSVSVCERMWPHTLMPFGFEALTDCNATRVTPVFTEVLEACITGAGLAGQLAARFFGRSFSHAVGYALADFVNNTVVLHGEAVGLGVLAQCVLDPKTSLSLHAMRDYFRSVHAPLRFSDLGIDELDGPAGRKLASAAYALLDQARALPFHVTEEALYQSLLSVEAADKDQA